MGRNVIFQVRLGVKLKMLHINHKDVTSEGYYDLRMPSSSNILDRLKIKPRRKCSDILFRLRNRACLFFWISDSGTHDGILG